MVDDTNLKFISMLEEQDALARPASLSTGAATAEAEVLARRSLLCSVVLDDEKA